MLRCRLLSLALLLSFILLALAPVGLRADEPGPRQQLEVSVNRLLDVLRDENLKGDERQKLRRERIAEVVFLQFNMRRMAKLSLGRDWKGLSETERSRFTELFKNLLKKSYVATIDQYADEQVSYLKEIIKGSKAEVRTMIISGSREIPLNYKLQVKDGKWLIYDVIIENVSLVRNYRSQFGPIVKKRGFDGLIAQMAEKIARVEEKEDG
ncbi:MAG: ABC transporter substrate-binding protein [Pseudomonadota bacterium]|nr:ABC transporter substrate-binding protein [Pseudomonadota bacterium]